MLYRSSQHDSANKNHVDLFHVEHGHVPCIHDAQNWEEDDRKDGSDGQWKSFRHPVDGHQDENVSRSTLLLKSILDVLFIELKIV